MLQQNDISPDEHQLWGDDFGKIKLVRYALANLDVLLKVDKKGKFDKCETLELIKWCKVKESTKDA